MNGLWRKVLVDDYLPCDGFDNSLVSRSSNTNEFWVSLIEKAYMKVCICVCMFLKIYFRPNYS
jgi:calpain-7